MGSVEGAKLAAIRDAVELAQEALSVIANAAEELIPPTIANTETKRIGITIRLPEAVHEQLRLLAFEQRSSKQALIESWVAERL